MTMTRTESDSMGPMEVPVDALYGPQTARAVDNFSRISGWSMGCEFIAAMGMVKQAAVKANLQAGRLAPEKADAIITAAQEVIDGMHDDNFPVDVFQTGSGTSSNMNANEVIANRAVQLLEGQLGDKSLIHPNDHVNMGQSSNDVIPTAIHISCAIAINNKLIPALKKLAEALQHKANEFDEVVKIGRTHLMDAVPVRLGQEFSGYAYQVSNTISLLESAVEKLSVIALGGTAVGTGLNAAEGFAKEAAKNLSEITGLNISETSNHFAEQAAKDNIVFASGILKTTAIAMGKIASDIRLMGSGPRCGIGELLLPSVQPGSSIMPGKVNPVMCESVIQVACQVVGCDAAVTAGATGGVGSILDLNVAMPMMACNMLTSINLLANVAGAFKEKCVAGLKPNEQRCKDLIEQSLAMVTVLAPKIGYDRAADLAKQAYKTGLTIRQICLEQNLIPADELEKLLDPRKQTE